MGLGELLQFDEMLRDFNRMNKRQVNLYIFDVWVVGGVKGLLCSITRMHLTIVYKTALFFFNVFPSLMFLVPIPNIELCDDCFIGFDDLEGPNGGYWQRIANCGGSEW